MKAKRFVAACSMAAVILSSSAAMALLRVATEHGLWFRGTTGAFGGGEVHSQYQDYVYYYSYAKVVNSKGADHEMTLPSHYGAACAKQTAYNFETDYAYYNFWD